MRGLEGKTFHREPDCTIADRGVFADHRNPPDPESQPDWKRSHQKHIFASGRSDAASQGDFDRLNDDTCNRILGRLEATLYEIGATPQCDQSHHRPRSARKSNFIWSLRRWYWTQPTLFSVAPLYLADWYGETARRGSRSLRSLGCDLTRIEREIQECEIEIEELGLWLDARNSEHVSSRISPHEYRTLCMAGITALDREALGWMNERRIATKRLSILQTILNAQRAVCSLDRVRMFKSRVLWRRRLIDLLCDARDVITDPIGDITQLALREWTSDRRTAVQSRLETALETLNAYHEAIRFGESYLPLIESDEYTNARRLFRTESGTLKPDRVALHQLKTSLKDYVTRGRTGVSTLRPSSKDAFLQGCRAIIDLAADHYVNHTNTAVSPYFQLQFAENFCQRHIGVELEGQYAQSTNVFTADALIPEDEDARKTVAQKAPLAWRIFVSTYLAAQEYRTQNFTLFVRIKRSEDMFWRSIRSLVYSVAWVMITLAAIFILAPGADSRAPGRTVNVVTPTEDGGQREVSVIEFSPDPEPEESATRSE